MKLLLDTHIWLWTLQDPKRLGRRVLHQLKDEANELWLSPISTWEALTLNVKGRIHIKGNLTEWLARATAGTREAPLTHEIRSRCPAVAAASGPRRPHSSRDR